ncbi:hypothetical protein BDD12DRAFT_828341 [Trichophaea hybrida]|nr:hypothetical protein BDD12DRAFT_828341 [Trichophaea hybrida]
MRTMKYRYASHKLHHVLLLLAVDAIPMTEAELITHSMPSPSLRPPLPSSTKLGGVVIHPPPPTVTPDLRRRQASVTDTLGWSDSSTCNIGVCDSGQYCTVFSAAPLANVAAQGVCCARYLPLPLTAPSY